MSVAIPKEANLVEFTGKHLCKFLNLPYEKKDREIEFEFAFPTGKVDRRKINKICLPAPVQEILDEFLEKVIEVSYERGFKAGTNMRKDEKDLNEFSL